jgi:7-carboxy-7-deazaguanine synthase
MATTRERLAQARGARYGAARTFPVIEVFGPVLQGEGRMIGVQTHFVRFGYCDFRCSWCLGPNTLVLLADGYRKRIGEVVVGDMLVAFDETTGTLQPTIVTRTAHHDSDDLWSLGVGNNTVCKRVVSTGDHLWMTTTGWVPTHSLQPDDIILSGHDFAINSWLKTRSNPMKDPTVSARVGAALKLIWTPELRDRHRLVQQGIASHRERMLGDRNPMKNPATVAKQIATRSDWRPSSIERRVQRLAQEAGLPFVLCIMSVRVGRRYPDFVVPGTKKAVEVYHPTYMHREELGYAETIRRDYAEQGWEVLPLRVRPSITDAEILEQLTKFALNGLRLQYVHPLPRKAHGALRGDLTVYDITCEPFPTFFANGLLTHNCDSLFAVEPEQVQAAAEWLDVDAIIARLDALGRHTPWVTLSGGNPAIHDLAALVERLHASGRRVAVETQGTVYRPWLEQCDVVTVSPKPPSSGMQTDHARLARFAALPQSNLKVVVFDDADFAYARNIHQRYPDRPFFIQPGNAVGQDDTAALLGKLDWLAQRAMRDLAMADAIVLPQLHTLMYGNRRGV